jgi:hypothetical protein
MNVVDDATGRTLARLGGEETIWAAADVLRRWIEAYGVALALYTDWKNVYVRVPNAAEQVTGAVPLTQCGRMCASLGIQIIAARSPQAKGRVERHHGTHQDRVERPASTRPAERGPPVASRHQGHRSRARSDSGGTTMTSLWKLPPPWTHRTRPPRRGKPQDGFPRAPTGGSAFLVGRGHFYFALTRRDTPP